MNLSIDALPLWESTLPGQAPKGGIQIFDKDSRERQSWRTGEDNILLRSKDTICMVDGIKGFVRSTFNTGSPENIMSLDAKDDTLYTYAADKTDGSPMIRAFGISEALLLEQAKKRIERSAQAVSAGEESLELEDDRMTIDGVSMKRQKWNDW